MKARTYAMTGWSMLCAAALVACGGDSDRAGTSTPPLPTVSVRWNPPSTDGDGGELLDLGGYMLYYGQQPGNYAGVIDVGNTTEYAASLSPGDYFLAVAAYDLSGNIGPYSNEIFRTAR